MPASVPTLTVVPTDHLLKDSGSGCGPDETFIPTMKALQARGFLACGTKARTLLCSEVTLNAVIAASILVGFSPHTPALDVVGRLCGSPAHMSYKAPL
jgi:hypothetical protein